MKTSPEQLDALRELINIGIGKAGGLLNELLNTHIQLNVPHVEVLEADDFERAVSRLDAGVTVAVQLRFRGPFDGAASLVFSQEGANRLVDLLTGQSADEEDFDEIKQGALSEIGNIVVNGVMGSIGNILNCSLEYSVPDYKEEEQAVRSVLNENRDYEALLLGHAEFCATEHVISGQMLLVFEVGSFQGFLDALDATLPEAQAVSE